MKLTKEEMNEKLLYVQELYVYYPANWNTAHQFQREFIDVVEKYFDGIKNITGGVRMMYGVRPATTDSGEYIRVDNIDDVEDHPDRLLIEIPSRWCDRCEGYRLFSLDGTMCLACGKKRYDPFMPPPEKEESK